MPEKPSILLLSNRDDLTTDFIATKLQEKNCSYIRINSEDIIERGFTIVPGKIMQVSYKDSFADISEIRSVYFRRVPSVFQNDISQSDRNFINRERKEFIEGLALSLNALWVNQLQATILGERKVFQLNMASKIGIRIPKTIITNEPRQARLFLEQNKNAIAKPVSHGLTIEDGEAYSIYTNQIDPSSFDSIKQLIEAPILLQENVDNKRDIRVTLIGTCIYSVAIEKDDNSIVDWRRPEIKKHYSVCDLPVELKNQLLELNKNLELVYSAIDLIQRHDGSYVFLEVNPVGEWLWLELELGLQISDEIIKCLSMGN